MSESFRTRCPDPGQEEPTNQPREFLSSPLTLAGAQMPVGFGLSLPDSPPARPPLAYEQLEINPELRWGFRTLVCHLLSLLAFGMRLLSRPQHLVPRQAGKRVDSGAVPDLRRTDSWCGAVVKRHRYYGGWCLRPGTLIWPCQSKSGRNEENPKSQQSNSWRQDLGCVRPLCLISWLGFLIVLPLCHPQLHLTMQSAPVTWRHEARWFLPYTRVNTCPLEFSLQLGITGGLQIPGVYHSFSCWQLQGVPRNQTVSHREVLGKVWPALVQVKTWGLEG